MKDITPLCSLGLPGSSGERVRCQGCEDQFVALSSDGQCRKIIEEVIVAYNALLMANRQRLLELANGRKVIKLVIQPQGLYAVIEGERLPIYVGPMQDGSIEDLLWING